MANVTNPVKNNAKPSDVSKEDKSKLTIETQTENSNSEKKPLSNNYDLKNIFNNRTYFIISLYIIFIILVGTVIWRAFGSKEASMAFMKFASVISPFIAGAFIAFILNPIVIYFKYTFFGKYFKIKNEKLVNVISILITYILFIGLIIVLLAYIMPQIILSLRDIAMQLPEWYQRTEDELIAFQDKHPNLDIDTDKIISTLKSQDFMQQIVDTISNLIPNVLTFLLTTSVTIIKLIVNLLIAIMVSIYLMADKKYLIHGFKRCLYAFFPSKVTPVVIEVLRESHNIFSGYIFGKAIDSFIIGILCFIAMTILRIDYAVLISVIVGITNMIPYFGPYIGGVIGGTILIITSPVKTIVFAIMILVLQQFDGLFLGPKILGKSVGIRPLWIIFAITVGGSLYGVVGMFLGVPVFTVISYIFNRIVDALLKKKRVKLDANDVNLDHHTKE